MMCRRQEPTQVKTDCRLRQANEGEGVLIKQPADTRHTLAYTVFATERTSFYIAQPPQEAKAELLG